MSLIDKKLASEVIDMALSSGGDFAEIFVENSLYERIYLAEKQVKDVASRLVCGVGIRVFCEDFQTYAYTNVMTRENLLKVACQVSKSIKSEKQIQSMDFRNLEFENLSPVQVNPFDVSKKHKIDFLQNISGRAYTHSQLIEKVSTLLNSKQREILVANSEGTWAEDTRVYSTLMLDAQARRDGICEQAMSIHHASQGFEILDKLPYGLYDFVEGTVDRAVAKTYAKNCPNGVMPVILANGFGGVIFHEACGHSLEARVIANNASEFCNKMGEQVASPLVTAYDDSLIAGANGTLNFDDEGTPTQRRLLIENGILKNYLLDKFYGRKLGLESNGAGRREDYTYVPVSRMSNTFIAGGKSKVEDIIASTEYGLYAKRLSGGSVNTVTGEFNFAVAEGYVVRNGKICEQVKGARLIGKGIDVLKKIDMVGNDFEISAGSCGACSGHIPVTVGQPTIRVSEMTVGGNK